MIRDVFVLDVRTRVPISDEPDDDLILSQQRAIGGNLDDPWMRDAAHLHLDEILNNINTAIKELHDSAPGDPAQH